MKRHLARLRRWILFTVVFALLPLAYRGFTQIVGAEGNDGRPPFDWGAFLAAACSGGEALIVAASFCAAVLGEMLAITERSLEAAKDWIAGLSLIIGFIAAALFAGAENFPASVIVTISTILLPASLIITSGGIVVGSIDKELAKGIEPRGGRGRESSDTGANHG